jgi:hypothetical protein
MLKRDGIRPFWCSSALDAYQKSLINTAVNTINLCLKRIRRSRDRLTIFFFLPNRFIDGLQLSLRSKMSQSIRSSESTISYFIKHFDHFNFSTNQLKRKRVAWKTTMRGALEAGRQKLSGCYSQTENVYGDLFAVGTILAPQHKL